MSSISDHTDLRVGVYRVWTKRYTTVTNYEQIDWDQIKCCLIKEAKATSKHTSSPAAKSAKLTTEAALKDVKKKYLEVLESDQVWRQYAQTEEKREGVYRGRTRRDQKYSECLNLIKSCPAK